MIDPGSVRAVLRMMVDALLDWLTRKAVSGAIEYAERERARESSRPSETA